ncbi:MAG: ribonuclease H-like domain-containing protein [Actinomycetota bacterium]|nr:ribonuclease H-like domain-containing protein [Actinomycetota bacterium]
MPIRLASSSAVVEALKSAGGGRSIAESIARRGAEQQASEERERIALHDSPGVASIVAAVDRRFGRVRLAERYDMRTVARDGARVHVITQPCGVRLPVLADHGSARRALLSLLEIVPGVGPVTAKRLRAGGVTSVEALGAVERFAQLVADICGEWDEADLVGICDRLQDRLAGRGHLLAALVAGCVELDELVFLDLETLGLAGNAIFLCGVGSFRGGGFVVDQYLAPGYADEAAMLAIVAEAVGGRRVLLTYNGRTADATWLRARSFFHGLPPMPEVAHVDLFYGTRRRFVVDEPVLASARLPVVQHQLLRMARPGYDVPSWAVPELYQHYVQTGREGLLVPVLDHNRSDLEALVLLLERLGAEALASCAPSGVDTASEARP